MRSSKVRHGVQRTVFLKIDEAKSGEVAALLVSEPVERNSKAPYLIQAYPSFMSKLKSDLS